MSGSSTLISTCRPLTVRALETAIASSQYFMLLFRPGVPCLAVHAGLERKLIPAERGGPHRDQKFVGGRDKVAARLSPLLQNVEPDGQADDKSLDDQLIKGGDAEQTH